MRANCISVLVYACVHMCAHKQTCVCLDLCLRYLVIWFYNYLWGRSEEG